MKKVPENVLRKIMRCRSFDRMYVKIYIILTCSAFFGIT